MDNNEKELLKREWLDFAEQSVIGSKLDISQKSGFMTTNITKDTIDKMLKSPYENYKQLQSCSRLFMTKEGIYFRLIKALSTILTYDCVLYPLIDPSQVKKNKKKIQESYSLASLYIEKLKIKQNAIRFCEDFLIDGEAYYYKIEDSSGIIYQKIDNEYCLPYQCINDVWKYVIDCSKLVSVQNLNIYPMEIQKAIEEFKINKDSDKFILKQYYLVKEGFCFTTLDKARHNIPPFSFLFSDLISLEDKKELKDKIDRINNTKMIHNKIDTSNPETMVDPSVAKKYNQAVKNNLNARNLEDGIFTITNPFEAQILNLNTKDSSTEHLVPSSVSRVFSDAGISEMLFNSGTSTEGLKKSFQITASLMVNMFLHRYEAYINYELKNSRTSITMICKILDTNQDNKDSVNKNAKDSLASGGSRLHYLATCGYTPLEGMNLLSMEQSMGIDKLFVPIQTSYTQSGKNSDKKGKPSSEEMTENGQEVSEITDKQKEIG